MGCSDPLRRVSGKAELGSCVGENTNTGGGCGEAFIKSGKWYGMFLAYVGDITNISTQVDMRKSLYIIQVLVFMDSKK
jgi:hypothetical protein